MKKFGRFSLAGAAVLALFLGLFGCSGHHKLVPGAPDWVNEGSGAFSRKDGKVFYGVGVVTGISSPSLSLQTADQRARADIARQLSTFVNELYRDYQASTAATGGLGPAEEQHVEDTLQSLTKISVRGARIVEHWKDPETDTLYTLARLDLNGLKGILEEMPELDPLMKNHIRARAEKVFDSMSVAERR